MSVHISRGGQGQEKQELLRLIGTLVEERLPTWMTMPVICRRRPLASTCWTALAYEQPSVRDAQALGWQRPSKQITRAPSGHCPSICDWPTPPERN
jgi:hypothetical protein